MRSLRIRDCSSTLLQLDGFRLRSAGEHLFSMGGHYRDFFLDIRYPIFIIAAFSVSYTMK